MKKISLVVTPERLKLDHPDVYMGMSSLDLSGLICAEYSVEPQGCITALGRWLAETISSTKFGDPKSVCKIILPVTEEGARAKEFGDHIGKNQLIASVDQAEKLFDEISKWVSERREEIRRNPRHQFQCKVSNFKWPIYGSAADDGAKSVEEYFDFCGRQIRRTGGVVIYAGENSSPLPEHLATRLADKFGGGLRLISIYRSNSQDRNLHGST